MVKVKVKLRKSTVEGKAGVIYYQLCHKRQSRQITTAPAFPRAVGRPAGAGDVSLAGRDAATAVVQRQIDGDLCLLRAIVGDFEPAGRNMAFRMSSDGFVRPKGSPFSPLSKSRSLACVRTGSWERRGITAVRSTASPVF